MTTLRNLRARTPSWRALGAVCLALAATWTQAADFPTRPVSLVVGSAPGGPTDVMARAVAAKLTEMWKQQVIIDSRPGASEVLAAQAVANAQPDGHTMMFVTEGPMLLAPFLFSKLPYNPDRDFVPVTQILSGQLAMIVPASLPARTLDEFIALARSRAANPMAYGSAGAGNVLQLPMVELSQKGKVELLHVPYRGVAPAVQDLLGGRLDAAWIGVSGAVPLVKDGRVRALLVGGSSRLKVLPDAAVASETSLGSIRADFMFALMAPANTPLAIRGQVAAAIKKIVYDPAFRETHLDPYGYVPVASTPREFEQFLAKDRPIQAERMKASGVKPE